MSVTSYFQMSSKDILLSVSLTHFSCPPCLEYLCPCALILERLWHYINHVLTYLLRATIQVSWKTWALLCRKFIQDITYQQKFHKRYDKNIWRCFSHSEMYYSSSTQDHIQAGILSTHQQVPKQNLLLTQICQKLTITNIMQWKLTDVKPVPCCKLIHRTSHVQYFRLRDRQMMNFLFGERTEITNSENVHCLQMFRQSRLPVNRFSHTNVDSNNDNKFIFRHLLQHNKMNRQGDHTLLTLSVLVIRH